MEGCGTRLKPFGCFVRILRRLELKSNALPGEGPP